MQERIVILAPRGRDAEVIESVLRRAGVVGEVCADLKALRACLESDLGAVLLTEESLAGNDLELLLAWCDGQPPWSDLPVIVLATKQVGRRPEKASDVLDRLGNVVLLERPINAETLASAARSALRARRRQYQARGLLLEQERAATRLRTLNETLEQRVGERTRELEGASETLAFALDSAEMGSWDLDLATDTSRRSPQHDRIFGYEEPLAVWGHGPFMAHVVEEDRPSVRTAFERAAQDGALDMECRIRRADGAVRWIAAKGRVEYATDRAPVRMAGVVMDTTDRRQTEGALRQAQKMEAVGQLTGGVAHDFNNLLTIIKSSTDLLRRPGLAEDRRRRYVDAISDTVDRASRLTGQLLAFARRQALKPEVFNVAGRIQAVTEMLGTIVGSRVRIVADVSDGPCCVLADASQFETALVNMAVNARDAMDGEGTLTVKVHRAAHVPAIRGHGARTGDFVCIALADTGSGIPADELAQIFEPFYTTKEVGKGTGLGLSQVFGFSKQSGGDVAVESAVGRGTTFTLYLPRVEGDEAREGATNEARTGAIKEQGRGRRVLVVEDNAEVGRFSTQILQDLGYETTWAANASEALKLLSEVDGFDVVFSDVVMPGMNGVALGQEICRRFPGLPVVLTSGYSHVLAEEGRHGFELLQKPYAVEDLSRVLRRVTRDQRGGEESNPSG